MSTKIESVCKKAHQIKPLRREVGDKGYDDEKNHEFKA